MVDKILKVENLKMHFPVNDGLFKKSEKCLKAVDGISFDIETGKTFGLVGESGCGKTTTGKCILKINKATSGSIIFKGKEITGLSDKAFSSYRRKIQIIFQDPYGSLDPRQSVGSILKEAICSDNQKHEKKEIEKAVVELLTLVELDPLMIDRYPHELSGGQRQRLGIARALACNPELIVCDEPVSALDVSIQAQIINLFRELQKKLNLSYLFIAHDLAIVQYIADEIGVMYLGHLVEVMTSSELYNNPLHPYTKALLSAVPITDYYVEKERRREVLEGEVPSPMSVPNGCPFHPRCKFACKRCKEEIPVLRDVSEGHSVACFLNLN